MNGGILIGVLLAIAAVASFLYIVIMRWVIGLFKFIHFFCLFIYAYYFILTILTKSSFGVRFTTCDCRRSDICNLLLYHQIHITKKQSIAHFIYVFI